ncbi:MAG: AAA family ATPase [Ktedonobacterales bacterium]|nr:AAA family ATPase [Ktedonobacterales bacterium]
MSLLEFTPKGALDHHLIAQLRDQWRASQPSAATGVVISGSALRYTTPEGLAEFATLLEAWHAERPDLPLWLCHLEPEIVLARQLADIGHWWQIAPDRATVLWELGLHREEASTTTTVLSASASAKGHVRPTGLATLDSLLGGGFEPGSVWYVEGAPGSGKSLLALHFLTEGLAQGEPGLYITAAEPPTKSAQAFAKAWPTLEEALTAGTLAVLDPSPFFTELRLAKERRTRGRVDSWDEVWRFVQDVTRQSRNQGAKRIVIDPLTPLLLAHESALDLWDITQTLVTALSDNMGATTLLSHVTLPQPEYVAIGGVLSALCHGVLRVAMQAGVELTIQGSKRRHAPWGLPAAQVTLGMAEFAPRPRPAIRLLEHAV